MNSEERTSLFYQEELRRLREDGARFAKRHPRIAGMLGMQSSDMPDPFVDRLLESTAWMTASVRADMKAHLPMVSQQILGLLYPNFSSPLPSMSVASFTPAENALQSQEEGFLLPAHSTLHCPANDGSTLRWRTAWPLRLHAVSVQEAHIESLSHGSVRLRLRLQGLQGLRLPELQFFLRGNRFTTFPLHDWILGHCNRVTLEVPKANAASTQAPADSYDTFPLPRQALGTMGLEAQDLLLPRGQYALPGYQLIQEYFAFPERFLFWRLTLTQEAHAFTAQQQECDLCLYMDEAPPETLYVTKDTFDFCAVPVVNLFERLADPLRVDHSRTSYRLVCDQRRENSTEVYSVLSVTALEAEGKSTEISPYFSLNASRDAIHSLYWLQRRVPADSGEGTDVHLTFKDTRTPLHRAVPYTVLTRLLCTNRNKAPDLLHPVRLSPDADVPATAITLSLPPTPQRSPAIFSGELWKLVSHLTLHKMSLSGDNGVQGLREILRLYAPPKDAYAQRQIAGIAKVSTQPMIQPMRQQLGGVARGTRIDVELDEEAFYGISPLIFGEVLNVFFGLYAEINTVTQLRLFSSARQGLWHEWGVRSGVQVV